MPRLTTVAILVAAGVLAPAAAEAHNLEVELGAAVGAAGVAEPVRGFVGAGARFILALKPEGEAIYSEGTIAGGSLRGAGTSPYGDVGLGYRHYFGPEPRRWFWSAELKFNVFGLDAAHSTNAVWLIGPAGEVGYHLASHLELRVLAEPAVALTHGRIGFGAPVMIGMDVTSW
jgi:hypothetical protein